MDCEYTLCFRAFTVVEHGDALAPNTSGKLEWLVFGYGNLIRVHETVESIAYLEKLGFLENCGGCQGANYGPLGLHPFSTARSKIR